MNEGKTEKLNKINMNRPDFSMYLAHFTKDEVRDENHQGTLQSAMDRLISILKDKKIVASKMPWTNAKAVCFTECPWSSLLDHTTRYSPYGIGFKKDLVYSKNGGPVFYIRPDHFNRQIDSGNFDEQLWPFLTPFSPSYRPKKIRDIFSKTVDYTHEREWRVPHDFPFEHKDVQFVVLPNYSVMASFPQDLKDAIGREKFILIDNYSYIERLWPVHIQ